MSDVEVTFLASNTYRIINKLRMATDSAIRKAAFDIAAQAKRNIIAQNAIDTGAMLNSVYVSGFGRSGYNSSIAAAQSAAAKPGMHSGRSHDLNPRPEHTVGNNEVLVSVAADYAPYVELGSSHTPARPFFGPAVQTVMPKLESYFKGMKL